MSRMHVAWQKRNIYIKKVSFFLNILKHVEKKKKSIYILHHKFPCNILQKTRTIKNGK